MKKYFLTLIITASLTPAASHAVKRTACDDGLLPNLPSILMQMEKEGLLSAIKADADPKMKGACALSAAITVTEVARRYFNKSPFDAKSIVAVAETLAPIIRKGYAKTKSLGMNDVETQGLLQFNLATTALDAEVQIRREENVAFEDLVIVPGELLLIGGTADMVIQDPSNLVGHVIVAFENTGDQIRAFDPGTGRIDTFTVKKGVYGVPEAYTLLNNNIKTSAELIYGRMTPISTVRISFEGSSRRRQAPNEDDQKIEMLKGLLDKLNTFKQVVQNPYPLLNRELTGMSPAEAREFIQNLYSEFVEAEKLVAVDPRIMKIRDPALVYQLKLLVAEIQLTMDESSSLVWFRHHNLLPPDPNAPKPRPQTSRPNGELQMYLSPEFKDELARMTELATSLNASGFDGTGMFFPNLVTAVNGYGEMAIMLKDLSPKEIHRVLTDYYQLVQRKLADPKIQAVIESDSIFGGMITISWSQVKESRKRVGLDN